MTPNNHASGEGCCVAMARPPRQRRGLLDCEELFFGGFSSISRSRNAAPSTPIPFPSPAPGPLTFTLGLLPSFGLVRGTRSCCCSAPPASEITAGEFWGPALDRIDDGRAAISYGGVTIE